MIAVYLVLLIPVIGMGVMALSGHKRSAGAINVRFNSVALADSIILAWIVLNQGPILSSDKLFYIDAFNVYLIVLTALVGLTTAIFSGPYMENERLHGRLNDRRLRLYYSMYQGFMLAMYLVLTTNNMGLLWVAMEGATLATVLLVSLYRTPESVEAAWKYFILCGVGIALALFDTIRRSRKSHSYFYSSVTEPKSVWCRCTVGYRMPIQKARHRCRPSFRACC